MGLDQRRQGLSGLWKPGLVRVQRRMGLPRFFQPGRKLLGWGFRQPQHGGQRLFPPERGPGRVARGGPPDAAAAQRDKQEWKEIFQFHGQW